MRKHHRRSERDEMRRNQFTGILRKDNETHSNQMEGRQTQNKQTNTKCDVEGRANKEPKGLREKKRKERRQEDREGAHARKTVRPA